MGRATPLACQDGMVSSMSSATSATTLSYAPQSLVDPPPPTHPPHPLLYVSLIFSKFATPAYTPTIILPLSCEVANWVSPPLPLHSCVEWFEQVVSVHGFCKDGGEAGGKNAMERPSDLLLTTTNSLSYSPAFRKHMATQYR